MGSRAPDGCTHPMILAILLLILCGLSSAQNMSLQAQPRCAVIDKIEDQLSFAETTAGVLRELTDGAGISFADKFQKIGSDRFIQAMKGFSTIATVLAALPGARSMKTAKIYSDIQIGFDKLVNDTENERRWVEPNRENEVGFNLALFPIVKFRSQLMNVLLQNGQVADKMRTYEFTRDLDLLMYYVKTQISQRTKERFATISTGNHYDENVFSKMKDSLTNAFFKSWAIRFFAHGIENLCKDGLKDLLALEEEAKKSREEFATIMKKVDEDFYNKKHRLLQNVLKNIVSK